LGENNQLVAISQIQLLPETNDKFMFEDKAGGSLPLLQRMDDDDHYIHREYGDQCWHPMVEKGRELGEPADRALLMSKPTS
jgi:hypothetical protein